MIKQIPIIEIELETLIIDSYKLLCSYLILFIMKVIQKHWIHYFKFKGYDPDNLNCDKVSVVFDDYKYNRLRDIMNDELDDIQEPNIIVLFNHNKYSEYGKCESINETFKSIQTYYNNIDIDDILNWYYFNTEKCEIGKYNEYILGSIKVRIDIDITEVIISNFITGKLILSTLDVDKFNMKVDNPLHGLQSIRWKVPFITSDYSVLVNSDYYGPIDGGFSIITSRNQDGRIFNNTLTYFKPSITYKVYTCKFGLFTIKYDYLIKEVAEVDNSLKYPITDTSINDFDLNINNLSSNIKFGNDNIGIATIDYINLLNGTNNDILLLGVNNTTRIMRLSPTTDCFTQMMLLREEIKIKKNTSFFII